MYLYEISIPMQNLYAFKVEKFNLFVLALFLFERFRCYMLLCHSEIINAMKTNSLYRAEQFSKEIIILVINIFLWVLVMFIKALLVSFRFFVRLSACPHGRTQLPVEVLS